MDGTAVRRNMRRVVWAPGKRGWGLTFVPREREFVTTALQRRIAFGAGIAAWKDFEKLTSARLGGND